MINMAFMPLYMWEMWDVTPVTHGRTHEHTDSGKVVQYSVWAESAISSYELPTSSEVPGSPFGQSDQSFNHHVFVPHHIVDRWTNPQKVKKSLLIESLCQSTLSFRVDFSAIVENIWDSVWTIKLAKIDTKINNQPTINYHQFNIRSNIYY